MFDWARMGCKRYRSGLEEYLSREGAQKQSDAELTSHVRVCADCRQALEDARLARDLVRQAAAPVVEASDAFVGRVMASIREEISRRRAPENIWRPLELMASKFAMVATVALLLMAAYLGKSVIPSHLTATGSAQQVTTMPEPPPQPSNPDEVAITLAEMDNGF